MNTRKKKKSAIADSETTPSPAPSPNPIDDNNEKIYLDSCSQDHIIKSFDLISNMSDCELNIGLSGIVQGKSEVLSKGCGTALGLNVQMQIQISFHVVN